MLRLNVFQTVAEACAAGILALKVHLNLSAVDLRGKALFHASHTVCEYPTSKGIIMKNAIIAISVLGLAACSSTPPTHVPMALNAPNVVLHYDAQVQQMSRQEVIQATMDCESAGMRASPVMSKRRVSGMLSDIIIDVQCIPRYRLF